MQPKVTILMPVYNAELYLKDAIDSMLRQTFVDFEFLIIDDASTDSSISIIESYRDSRIRFIKNDRNLGISATLNKGIELATCELIARMDADDISYPDRLQKQYAYMLAHPKCALLSSWVRVITHDGNFVRLEKYRSNFYYYNLTFECWIYHPSVMFRREYVRDVGMYSMTYSEDYDLFWKLSVNYEIGNLAEPLLDYRLSPTSLHTVLRKEEYDITSEEIVLRNLRYYMGDQFELTKPYLECLRHNFVPLLQIGNVQDIIKCIAILDSVNAQMLNRNDLLCAKEDIKQAAYYKKQFILTHFGRELPIPKAVVLLISTGSFSILAGLVRDFFKWRINFKSNA